MTGDANSHIIQKHSIEIHFTDADEGVEAQRRIADLFYERLEPAMTKLFDDLVGTQHAVNIDRLEIDCGTLSAKYWEQELIQQVVRKLSDHLRQADKRAFDRNSEATEALLWFLENGVLRWNTRYASVKQMEQVVIVDQSLIDRIVKITRTNALSGKRLLYQFSEEFKSKLLGRMMEAAKENLPSVDPGYPESIESLPQNEKDTLLLKLFESVIKPERILQIDRREKMIEDDGNRGEDLLDGLYINNAGVVLLHPFLPTLFEKLGLTKGIEWVDEDSQRRAILIIQFLAGGQLVFPEYDLPLNKLLCSYAINEPVENEIEFTEAIRKECDELLTEVIRHWSRLKNTGIDALRESFLQRFGKLSRVNDSWLLQVEQRSIDVLLTGLPWGIGVVKLPWMQEILYVEWA